MLYFPSQVKLAKIAMTSNFIRFQFDDFFIENQYNFYEFEL